MPDIAFADLEREVRRLAAENPTFVYRASAGIGLDCAYVRPDGEGGLEGDCLWGQALTACGIDPNDLRRFDGDGGARIGAVLDSLGVAMTESEWIWARNVQRAQDRHAQWGIAVDHAHEQDGVVTSEDQAGG